MNIEFQEDDHAYETFSNLDTYIDAYLNINEANAVDTALQNPYLSQTDLQRDYLTFDKIMLGDDWDSMELHVQLSETKLIKSRQVYSLIELISEVSGF